jgi:hypothetical protein
MKITQTNEKDFKDYEIEVDDELYIVAEQIQKIANCNMPIVATKNGKELLVRFAAKDRHPGERDTHSYIVRIKKIPYM